MTKYHRHVHQKARRTLILKKQTKFKLVDRLTYFAAVVEPFVTFPQAYTIFHERSASTVSISTWLGYDVFTMVWLWYGLAHKEKVIVIYQGLFFVLNSAVLVGSFMYGGHW